MQVHNSAAVDAALRTLALDDRCRVLSWFEHLRNWENDEQVRKMSKAMSDQRTFVLNTSDDFRIFFALNEAKREIEILDLAKPSRFKSVAMASE